MGYLLHCTFFITLVYMGGFTSFVSCENNYFTDYSGSPRSVKLSDRVSSMEMLLNILMESFLKMNDRFIQLLDKCDEKPQIVHNVENEFQATPLPVEKLHNRTHFIVFGVISMDAEIISGSHNFEVQKLDTGVYQISILNETIYSEPSFLVNAEGMERCHATHYRNQNLSFIVTTWDIIGNPRDVSFSFISIGKKHT